MAICLVSFKCLMAYFGQLCHCMSHTPAVRRPTSISWLQNAGFMISPKEHAVHHRTYDSNFCIGSGLCNPLITWMLANLTSNKWAWLSLFIISMVCDVPIFNYLLTSYCGFEWCRKTRLSIWHASTFVCFPPTNIHIHTHPTCYFFWQWEKEDRWKRKKGTKLVMLALLKQKLMNNFYFLWW